MKVFLRESLLAATATGLLALPAVLPACADYSNTVMTFNPGGYWRLNDATPIPKHWSTNSGTLGATAAGVHYGGSPPTRK